MTGDLALSGLSAVGLLRQDRSVAGEPGEWRTRPQDISAKQTAIVPTMEADQLDISQLGPFFGLALIDALNPSAIAVTVLLIAQPHFPARVAAYLLGVFVTYLTLGVVGVLGLSALWSHLNTIAGHAITLALGLALLGYAVFAPNRPVRQSLSGVERRGSRSLVAIFLLGVTVTIAEISTALPYLAAIGILADAQTGPTTWAPLLAAYNLIFIAPPLFLVFAALMMGRLAQPVLDRFGAFIRSGARETMLWLFGIAGFYLSAISAGLLAADLGLLGDQIQDLAAARTRVAADAKRWTAIERLKNRGCDVRWSIPASP